MASNKPTRTLISGFTAIGMAALAALLLPALPGRTSADSRANIVSPPNRYVETKLLSNIPGFARFKAPDLKNPWGLTFFPGNPFWIADNNSGFSTVNEANGMPDFVVKIPLPPGSKSSFAAPTGIVANTTADFHIGASGAAFFIFSSEDGTITAWNGGPSAVLMSNQAPAHAIYKGLAMGSNKSGNFLYATDFHNRKVQVFDKNFHVATLMGGFKDPSIPAGFAPFGIVNLKNQLFVTYAKQDALKINDDPGPGNGFVDIFDTEGNLKESLLAHGALNSPWGVAMAPSNFGAFSNSLLVGNLGDGTIHAYLNKTLLGALEDQSGRTLVLDGLWALVFGDGSVGKPANTLFFTAGITQQNNGLFGSLTVARTTPTPTRKPTPTPTKKKPTPTPTKKHPTPTPTKKAATPTPTKKRIPTPTKKVGTPHPTPTPYWWGY